MSDDDHTFASIDRLLQQIQIKHFELAGMVDDYREMVADARQTGDSDAVTLARSLPGARYQVSTTYIRETWNQISADLKRAFPES